MVPVLAVGEDFDAEQINVQFADLLADEHVVADDFPDFRFVVKGELYYSVDLHFFLRNVQGEG